MTETGAPGLTLGPPVLVDADALDRRADRSPARRTLDRFLSHRLAVFGALVLALMALGGLFAPIVAPHDPNKIDLLQIAQSPSLAHPLGTDAVGRDSLSRIIYGARISLAVGVCAVGIYIAIGFVLGALAGYVGG